MWTNIKRIIRTGFVSFWRNGFVSLASMLVMTITLLVLGAIIFGSVILTSALEQIKDKVDINVYFVTNAPEGEILALKQSIEALPQVETVTYMSREQVLADFKARHENDEFDQALSELPDNPLGAVLNVRATDPTYYADISSFIESKSVSATNGLPIIDKVNYRNHKVAIEKLTNLIDSGQKVGIFLTLVLTIISIMITFNTIRLAIYISREEISIMRLVGASSKYVRGPFVVIGILYGVFSAIITMVLYYPVTFYLGRASEGFFAGININDYYIRNFGQIFLIILVAGVVVGAVSSFLAVRRYLKV